MYNNKINHPRNHPLHTNPPKWSSSFAIPTKTISTTSHAPCNPFTSIPRRSSATFLSHLASSTNPHRENWPTLRQMQTYWGSSVFVPSAMTWLSSSLSWETKGLIPSGLMTKSKPSVWSRKTYLTLRIRSGTESMMSRLMKSSMTTSVTHTRK